MTAVVGTNTTMAVFSCDKTGRNMAEVSTTQSLLDLLNKLRAAREAIAKNQSYTVGTVTYTRQNPRDLYEQIAIIEGRLSRRTYGSRMDVEIVR